MDSEYISHFELLLKTTPWKYDILFKLQMHSGVISPTAAFISIEHLFQQNPTQS